MTVLDHDLQRSLHALTIGVVRSTQRRAARRNAEGLREFEYQVQIPISGQADTEAGWDVHEVAFASPFYYAPGNRASDFDVPQLRSGASLDAEVMVSVHVSDWKRDVERSAVVGALVKIGVAAPGTAVAIDYSGVVHLTFQGYGALDDAEDET